MIIAVIGASECTPEEAAWAEEVGREIAKRGHIVVCGGLGGVMEAVCRGARGEGGTTVGILPGNSPDGANPYVSIPIVTGLGFARNALVVKTAKVVIAIAGSYGTLSEIGHALQNGIPVVGLHTWSLARKGKQDNAIVPAHNPQEAVAKALEMVKGEDGHH